MALQTDEISIKVQAVADKAIGSLTKLADKYGVLGNAIKPITNALQKTGDVVTATANRFKNLSKTAEETADDFEFRLKRALNLTPKIDTSEYEAKLNEIMAKHKKLSSAVNNFNEMYKRFRYAEPGSDQAKLYEENISKRTISNVPGLDMNIGEAEQQLQVFEQEMNEIKQTINEINEKSVAPNLSDVIQDIDDAEDALIILNEDLERAKGTGGYAGINAAMKTIEKQFGVTRKEALATGENVDKVDKNAKKASHSVGILASVFGKTRSSSKGLAGLFSGMGKTAGKMFEGATHKLKKFGLGLMAVRTTMSFLTRSVNAYLQFDGALQDSVSNSWNMMGALLGPAIEYVANMFAQATAYIYSFIKALTGIDLVARANAKAMDKQAKATGGAAKEAQKALAPFDEIFNINQEKGSGGGGGSLDLIEVPEIKASSFLDDIMRAIKEGDWYKVGYLVADKLADAMESIPWGKIQKTASKIGKNLALFINGAVDNKRFWYDLGDTLAQGLNTAILFLYNFIETWNAEETGKSIGLAIATAIKNIKWSEFFQTIADGIAALLEFLTGLLTETDYSEAQDSMVNGLFNVDLSRVTKAISKFIASVIPEFINIMTGFKLWELLDQYVIQPAIQWCVEKLTEGGGLSIEGLLTGILDALKNIGTWIYDNMLKPFWDGFKKAFEIASPSKLMKRGGEYIVDGFIEGIKNIPQKAKEKFEELKNSIQNKLTEIKTRAGSIATDISNAIVNGFRNLKNGMQGKIKDALNGAVSLINRMVNAINSRLNISVSGSLAKVLNKLGVEISSGRHQLFTIPNVPSLDVGTNRILEEGLYHLHEDEAVVPKKYNPALGGGFEQDDRAVEETNSLLRALIDVVESKDYQPKIGVDDIGKASVDYIRKQRRVTGGSVI